jgi:Glyoxalase-like domain
MKLDHLMIAAADWRAARQAYTRLGFKVTELRRNVPMGGADGSEGGSQLIMLRGFDDRAMNYLELSTTVPAKAAPLMNRILRADGPAMLVNFSEQIGATEKKWRDMGLRLHRFDASFPSSGSLGGGVFSIVIIDPEDSPLQINAVFSPDRSAYHVQEWFTHENGALGWTDVYCLIPDADFDRVDRFYAEAHNVECDLRETGRTTYLSGQVKVHLISHSARAVDLINFESPFLNHTVIAAFRIAVADVDKLEQIFKRNAVTYCRNLDVITVGPSETCGSVIQFAQAN